MNEDNKKCESCKFSIIGVNLNRKYYYCEVKNEQVRKEDTCKTYRPR